MTKVCLIAQIRREFVVEAGFSCFDAESGSLFDFAPMDEATEHTFGSGEGANGGTSSPILPARA